MFSKFIFQVIFLLVFWACLGLANSIEFREIQSMTVPGLQTIRRVQFGDADLDGHLDVLATDRNTVVLYSPYKDQVLFQYDIHALGTPTYEDQYNMLLADINHDYIPDIAIGVSNPSVESPGTLKIFFYNGTGFLGMIDTTTVVIPTEMQTISYGLGLFEAVDFDADGYKEFIFSCDSLVEDWDSYNESSALYGITRIYRSFPDSLIYEDDNYYIGAEPLPPPNDHSVILQQHTDTYFHMMGSTHANSTISFRVLSDYTLSPTAVMPDLLETAYSPFTCDNIHDYDAARIKCLGNIETHTSSPEVVVAMHMISCCNDTPDIECVSGASLKLYSLQNLSSIAEIRELNFTDSLSNFICLPGYPGYYFAFRNESFYQFDGADGSEFQSTDYVPYGSRFWAYPFDDGQPYLVAFNSRTVSIFQPSVITDADGGEDLPLPTTLSLGHPYPNPFNASQTIPVTVRPGERLTIEVYNLLGQKVDEIYSGVSYAHEMNLTWQADHFASGIYLIRAQSGAQTAIVKSILMK